MRFIWELDPFTTWEELGERLLLKAQTTDQVRTDLLPRINTSEDRALEAGTLRNSVLLILVSFFLMD
jgi:hypothetical protein